jgi:hypothetical protein
LSSDARRAALVKPDAAPALMAPLVLRGTGFAAQLQVGPSHQSIRHEGSNASAIATSTKWPRVERSLSKAPWRLIATFQPVTSSYQVGQWEGPCVQWEGRSIQTRSLFPSPLQVRSQQDARRADDRESGALCHFGAPQTRAEAHFILGRKFTPNGRATEPWSRPAMGGRVVFSERFGFGQAPALFLGIIAAIGESSLSNRTLYWFEEWHIGFTKIRTSRRTLFTSFVACRTSVEQFMPRKRRRTFAHVCRCVLTVLVTSLVSF